jgi:WXG100 family type VII secretion target
MTGPLDGSEVNHISMGVAAQKVSDTTDVITGLENQVDSHLQSLLAGWKGDASFAFERLLIQWLQDFRQIRDQLDNIYLKLTGTQKSYQANEQAETDAINQLSSMLNHHVRYTG